MATGPDDVRFQRKNGSSQPTAKMTRLMLWTVADALHLREFRSPAIFEFFNTIDPKRTNISEHVSILPWL
jgi:hypothetical protein